MEEHFRVCNASTYVLASLGFFGLLWASLGVGFGSIEFQLELTLINDKFPVDVKV